MEEESYSTDEWGLQEEHFQLLLQEFQVQPTIDAFASQFNNRCASFYSNTSQKGAAGIDFFAQELRRGEVYYCCPPVKLAAHCIRRIWSSRGTRAVLIRAPVIGRYYCTGKATSLKSSNGTVGGQRARTQDERHHCLLRAGMCRCGRG